MYLSETFYKECQDLQRQRTGYVDVFRRLIDNSEDFVLFGIGDLVEDNFISQWLKFGKNDFLFSVVDQTGGFGKSL